MRIRLFLREALGWTVALPLAALGILIVLLVVVPACAVGALLEGVDR